MSKKSTRNFRTDRDYQFCVHDVSVNSEAGLGAYSERVDVVFLAVVAGVPTSDEEAAATGRPKACIAMRFDADWRPRDEGTEQLLQSLGVPLPVPAQIDWEKELANRRVLGRFLRAPRDGARNPLGKVKPVEQALGDGVADFLGRGPADVPGAYGGQVRDDGRRGKESGHEDEAARPRWDNVLRRLTWNGELVASYIRSAPNQATILSAFEEEGWPPRVDDPLTPCCLRQTLKDLQEKFRDTPIVFVADGTGKGIRWERRTS